ncbi:MAG: Asp-tRNA(Asn)/Glu-tRNA(Gln) amidotransferase subunit GatB [Patescibacteria group bacterium]
MKNKYEPVIGLEIHVQLKTKSKMFCRCDNAGENQPPNTTICPICTGHPGVLPSANGQAIEWAVAAAMALGCEINTQSHFDRKSYFYPDLPKGYQISQYTAPFGHDGHLVFYTGTGRRRVRIERVHLEEDTGKLLHEADKSASYVDYNRAGTPLMEVVTRPDLTSPAEAKAFLQELRLIMRYLRISDADMEKGHLRCDANISLRPNPEYFQAQAGHTAGIGLDPNKLYPKTEVKNLNSFKAVERALAYEIKRQTKLWDEGKAPKRQSTHGWDDKKGVTVLQRVKEEQHDYRYFPEPDLPPVSLSAELIKQATLKKVELPSDKRERFVSQWGLSAYDASILVSDKSLADYFEAVIAELSSWILSLGTEEGTEEEIWERHKVKLVKLTANWVISRLMQLVNDTGTGFDQLKITAEHFAELMTLMFQRRLNNQTAAVVLKKMFATGDDPSDIMETENLGAAEDDGSVEKIIESVLAQNPDIVGQYKSGKTAVLQFLIGLVMKETKGRADAKKTKEILLLKLH